MRKLTVNDIEIFYPDGVSVIISTHPNTDRVKVLVQEAHVKAPKPPRAPVPFPPSPMIQEGLPLAIPTQGIVPLPPNVAWKARGKVSAETYQQYTTQIWDKLLPLGTRKSYPELTRGFNCNKLTLSYVLRALCIKGHLRLEKGPQKGRGLYSINGSQVFTFS